MSTFSPSLRIELIDTGSQAGVWGTTTNTNLGTLIESAIAGYVSVLVTSANQAFTALDGAADQARNMSIALTTSTTDVFNVYAPPAEKTYVIYNASAYVATIYNSTVRGNTTAAGAGVAIPSGKTMTVWSDGTNFQLQNTHIVGTVVGDVTGNVVGNVTGQLDGTVTGTTTGVTQSPGNNTTRLATTAFVTVALSTLGTMATQNANAVNITGGTITGITDLAIADGGTGASTAASARTNLGTNDAANITTGTLGTARLASGTASNTTYLRGDQTWSALPVVGVGQTWQNVAGSRVLGTTYTNTTGAPIQVMASIMGSGTAAVAIVSGVTIANSYTVSCCGVPQISYFPLSFIVPVGATYSITGMGVSTWAELR